MGKVKSWLGRINGGRLEGLRWFGDAEAGKEIQVMGIFRIKSPASHSMQFQFGQEPKCVPSVCGSSNNLIFN